MNNADENPTDGSGSYCDNVMWWAMLVIAVLAVPSFGIVITMLTGAQGFFQVSIFIVTCWLCTYLGMRLMQNPKVRAKLELDS